VPVRADKLSGACPTILNPELSSMYSICRYGAGLKTWTRSFEDPEDGSEGCAGVSRGKSGGQPVTVLRGPAILREFGGLDQRPQHTVHAIKDRSMVGIANRCRDTAH
jgi:hypothetical protein